MRTVIRVILVLWFVVLNLFVFVPAFVLLTQAFRPEPDIVGEVPAPPVPPVAPTLTPIDFSAIADVQDRQVGQRTHEVEAYTQQVAAFTAEVTAYASQLEANALAATRTESSQRLEVYTSVVSENLVTLLSGFVIALLGYVFATAATVVVSNRHRMANELDPLPLTLF